MDQDSVIVDVFVRSLARPGRPDRLDEAVARLERLEADGVIDDYDVHVWGERIATGGAATETGTAIRNRVAAFQQWALSENVSVHPFFTEQESQSALTDSNSTALELSQVALAEYEGQTLVSMSPHVDGDTVGVRDHLNEIEARRGSTVEEQADAAARLAVPGSD